MSQRFLNLRESIDTVFYDNETISTLMFLFDILFFICKIPFIWNNTLQITPMKALKDSRNQYSGVHPPMVIFNTAVIIPIISMSSPPKRKTVINVPDPSVIFDDFSTPAPPIIQ